MNVSVISGTTSWDWYGDLSATVATAWDPVRHLEPIHSAQSSKDKAQALSAAFVPESSTSGNAGSVVVMRVILPVCALGIMMVWFCHRLRRVPGKDPRPAYSSYYQALA